MALSHAPSLVDGGGRVRGGDGGDGAEGGGRDAYGGGSPCPADGGGGDRTVDMFGSPPAGVVEMGVAVVAKTAAAADDDDQGWRGVALTSGGCDRDGARGGAAVDGMVGVVEEAAAVDTAPKA